MIDLSQKVHDMIVTSVSDGECDRGCCEHSHRLVKCSCGFESTLPESYWPSHAPRFSVEDRHLQEVLAFQLEVAHSVKGYL